MRKLCRYFAAGVLIAGCAAASVWAGDSAPADLEARMLEMQERFGSRMEVSEAARSLRSTDVRADAAVNDFIVNNDGFGGASNQIKLQVGRQPDGGTITVWTDDRDANLSVYGQIFNAARDTVGPNFRLHTDPNNWDQYDPAIAVRSDGGFYTAYARRKATGDLDVIVQRYSAKGQPLGTARNVASDSTFVNQSKPALAIMGNGDVVVMYQRDSLGINADVWGRVFNRDDLAPKGNKFYVARDLYIGGTRVSVYDEREPAVGVGGNDTVWVVWTDNRDGGVRDVFGQRLYRPTPTDTLRKLGSIFKINDEPIASNAFQNTPRIAVAADGRALVAWADFRNGNWDVFKQSYAANGTKNGTNQIVNFTDVTGSDQLQPSVGWIDSLGVVVWKDYRNGNARAYYQRYHADGGAIAVNQQAGVATTANESNPDADISTDGTISVGWSTPVNGLPTVYFRTIDSQNVASSVVTIADVIISAKQVHPTCAIGSGGDVFTAWEESRAALPNIVGQAINNANAKVGSDRQLNGGRVTFHFFPSVGVGGTAGYAAWEDYRDTIVPVYSDIFLQRFTLTSSGYAPNGTNVRVIDTVESPDARLAQWYPDVACDANGNAMVVWQDDRNGSWDIYGAVYTPALDPTTGSAVRLGRNARVDQGPGVSKQTLPRIDMNQTGHTAVVWEDNRGGTFSFAIWGRVYTNGGRNAANTGPETAADSNFMVAPDSARQPDVAVATDGSFAVVYERKVGATSDIYLARFTAAGVPSGAPILVNDDGLSINQFLPRIAVTSAGYVVVWQDERNGNWDVYGSVVPVAAGPAGANFLVNDISADNQTNPMIASLRTSNSPFICWTDLRDFKTAPDIFGNRNPVTSIASGIDDDGTITVRPETFSLEQNYPNPFNPATEIQYALSEPGQVVLDIYNTLGQKVRTLVDAVQPAGENRAVWDGCDEFGQPVASGVYFYRLATPQGTVARKMTLLR